MRPFSIHTPDQASKMGLGSMCVSAGTGQNMVAAFRSLNALADEGLVLLETYAQIIAAKLAALLHPCPCYACGNSSIFFA